MSEVRRRPTAVETQKNVATNDGLHRRVFGSQKLDGTLQGQSHLVEVRGTLKQFPAERVATIGNAYDRNAVNGAINKINLDKEVP